MRLVDTSAWIEWLLGSRVGETVSRDLPETDQWLVPTIVQLELAKWTRRQLSDDRADRLIAFTKTCVIAPLDTPIAISAAEVSARHKLPIADAIVYATSAAYGADLLTCDRHFEGLDGVRYVARSAI
jgi:predicted nucleic acid-binding protein